jgi:uncharacterized protein YcbK (DUF882 family)
MGDVSKNFSRSEFRCKCNECNFETVDVELVNVLQDVRDHFRSLVKINSACRCPVHNAKVGGAKRSKHLLGIAADIAVKGHSPEEVYSYISDKYEGKFGVMEYNTFVHVDVRRAEYRRPLSNEAKKP